MNQLPEVSPNTSTAIAFPLATSAEIRNAVGVWEAGSP